MPTKKINNHIYDKKIREYEQEIINFIVESGKNKRRFDIESHVLAYFLLREGQWLSQDNIRELSLIFYKKESKKGISKGSISKTLNIYERYRALKKRKVANKKNAFEYSMSEPFNQLMFSAIEYGLEEIEKYISFFRVKLISLKEIIPKIKEEEFLKVILIERVQELIDFFIFHKNLLENNLRTTLEKEETIAKLLEVNNIQTKKSVSDIESDIIEFILDCPLFVIEETKYSLIMAYFFTRKRLTQEKIKKLTNFSAGMVSECVNYLIKRKYIKLEKIKGIRKRFYKLSSIAYYNYLRFYRRFKSISRLYRKLNELNNKLERKREELQNLYGYININKQVKQFLNAMPLVEKLVALFSDAKEKFGGKIE
ncbi:MAG: hypothetical protein ACFFBT_16495 [Promethearchaeota archaeon]